MPSLLTEFLNNKKVRQLTDIRNIGLYIFGLMIVAIAWSGAKTVQSNYDLQKKIAVIKQENDVLWLLNSNTYLKNQYYKTDQYLELSARQNLGLAAPGEHVLLVPKGVAAKYVDPNLNKTATKPAEQVSDNRSSYVKNLEAWRDFILGRSRNIN